MSWSLSCLSPEQRQAQTNFWKASLQLELKQDLKDRHSPSPRLQEARSMASLCYLIAINIIINLIPPPPYYRSKYSHYETAMCNYIENALSHLAASLMASGTMLSQQLRHLPHASGAAPTVMVSIVATAMKAPSTIIRSEIIEKRKLHIQAEEVSG